MLNLVYTAHALDNIEDIAFNITEFAGAYSAIHVIDDIKKSIDLLAYAPEMGVVGEIQDTREIYPRGYRVVYSIIDGTIYIRTIVHCRRLYPPLSPYENQNEI